MLAVRMRTFGAPEVLVLEEVDDAAAPRGDQVLVQVHSSSLNGTDLGLRRGDLKIATWGRMPFTLGFDIAGTVKACGPEVTAFAVGDHVMALIGHGGGGQAEEVLVPQSALALTPTSATWSQTAALPLAGLAGSRVSAVGSAGKLHALADLGVHENIPRESFSSSCGQKWDVVLDTHGGMTAANSRRLVRPGGVVVTTRPVSRAAVLDRIVPRALARGESRYTSVMTSARSQDLTRLAALVDQGRLHPLVDSTFNRSEAVASHRRAEGQATGKVIIRMRNLGSSQSEDH